MAKRKTANQTLASIARRAERDPKFFRALLRNPTAALEAARIKLSKPDAKKLTGLVRDAGRNLAMFTKRADAEKVKAALLNARVGSSGQDWPSPEWPMQWMKVTFRGGRPAEIKFKKLFD